MAVEVCVKSDFTVEYTEKDERPTLEAPAFAMVDSPFEVTGMTPEPNQGVWIEDEKYIDEKIAEGVSDAEGKFTIEVTLTAIAFVKIHSEIEKPWAINPKSATRSVVVIDWWVIGVVVVLVLFLLYRMGVFDKIAVKVPKKKVKKKKKKAVPKKGGKK